VQATYAAGSPTPHELVAAPELALVLALQQLLEVTTAMLAAVHPELLVDDRPRLRPLAPQAILADQLIKLGAHLAKTATDYRVVVIAALHAPDTDDIRF
jgi:hypothetical protein